MKRRVRPACSILNSGGVNVHEFSIAQQIVEVVLKTAKEQDARQVERVTLVIGELTLLNGEQVGFWVEEAFSRRPLTRGARLDIDIRSARVHCRGCGFEGPPSIPGPEAHFLTPSLICPQCGRTGMEIREGRECLIKRITLIKDDDQERKGGGETDPKGRAGTNNHG